MKLIKEDTNHGKRPHVHRLEETTLYKCPGAQCDPQIYVIPAKTPMAFFTERAKNSKTCKEPGLVANACNLNTQKAEAGGSQV
jgi:hypothetical protein